MSEHAAGAAAPRPTRRQGTIGLVGAAAAAALTVVWLVVVPEKADEVGGVQAALIRYGHPACWALLAGAGVAYATGRPHTSRVLGYAALACYAAFILAFVL
ncbi:MAG: hypothetical protein WCA30_17110 [Dermatophilaceae bacterium]